MKTAYQITNWMRHSRIQNIRNFLHVCFIGDNQTIVPLQTLLLFYNNGGWHISVACFFFSLCGKIYHRILQIFAIKPSHKQIMYIQLKKKVLNKSKTAWNTDIKNDVSLLFQAVDWVHDIEIHIEMTQSKSIYGCVYVFCMDDWTKRVACWNRNANKC